MIRPFRRGRRPGWGNGPAIDPVAVVTVVGILVGLIVGFLSAPFGLVPK